jgi:DNA-binding transcriptional LysR family regulator
MSREILHERVDADWEDLRHFAAFARSRTLSGAARRLGVDHVTVARRMRGLEDALGVKLVDRRARIPALTAEGARIAALVARMEDDANAIARAARGLQPELGGVVSISAPPTVINALIAPRLPELRARHPQLALHLLGEKRIASLSRREADVALRLVRPTEAGVVTRKVGSFEFGLYGARRYVADRRSSELELIAFDDESDALPQQKWLLAHRGARRLVLRTNDLESQLAAVRAGVGVATLPSFLAARHPELVHVALRARPVTREIWLVVHDDLRAAPSVRAVMDFLVDATAELR